MDCSMLNWSRQNIHFLKQTMLIQHVNRINSMLLEYTYFSVANNFRGLLRFFAFLLLLLIITRFAKPQTTFEYNYEQNKSNNSNGRHNISIVVDKIIDAIHLETLEVDYNCWHQIITEIRKRNFDLKKKKTIT